jgi:hypothetical protein
MLNKFENINFYPPQTVQLEASYSQVKHFGSHLIQSVDNSVSKNPSKQKQLGASSRLRPSQFIQS